MLELKNISFAYKENRQLIDSVSFSLLSGEFVGLIGRNGSGKTTLTKLIMALKKPDQGQIYFAGQDMKKANPADMARHIGYVFQNPERQMFRETVQAEVAYGPEQLGFSAEETAASVKKALELTGLTELAKHYPLSLSKNQKQLTALASAVAMRPKLLILDEPTSGQDAASCALIAQMLKKLNQKGTAILLITHDMELLFSCATRSIVMENGHKVFDGATKEVFAQPEQAMRWGLAEPAILALSRSLAASGIACTAELTDLKNQLLERIGGNEDA